MEKEIIFIVEEDPEGGYNASALVYSIVTQGETLAVLKENIKDAIRCHFDKMEDAPKIIRLHIVTEELFSYA